jgi:ribonuclease BN (tRNA processing enzyme)
VTNAVTLLGTKGGPSLRKGSPSPSSSVLQINSQTILIDCGIGATRALVEADISLSDLDAIIITHLHSDHLLDLGPLIYTAWTSGPPRRLPLYGPPGLRDYWQNFLKAMNFDHSTRTIDDKRKPLDELIDVHEYGEGTVASFAGIEVSALRVDHPPVTDCFALRFKTVSQTVVFSADTCYFQPLAEFAKNADLLVHEAMLSKGIDALVERLPGAPGLRAHLIASHTMAEDVGRIAEAAKVRKLVLNHLVPADDPSFTDADWQEAIASEWDGPVTVGRDGMRILLTKGQ